MPSPAMVCMAQVPRRRLCRRTNHSDPAKALPMTPANMRVLAGGVPSNRATWSTSEIGSKAPVKAANSRKRRPHCTALKPGIAANISPSAPPESTLEGPTNRLCESLWKIGPPKPGPEQRQASSKAHGTHPCRMMILSQGNPAPVSGLKRSMRRRSTHHARRRQNRPTATPAKASILSTPRSANPIDQRWIPLI
jgi:hypothetical protein